MTTPFTATGRDRHGRTAWWYWGRGLVLFITGFGLSFLGHFAHWRWLQFTAFGIAVIAMGIFFRGWWLAERVRRARYWEWFDEQQARNDRAIAALQDRPSSRGPL
jgi:hypothetical protein